MLARVMIVVCLLVHATAARADERPEPDDEREASAPLDEAIDVDDHGVRASIVGPRVADVVAVAYRVANLDRDRQASWNRRARLGGLVPWLSVRTGRNTSWQEELEPDVDHGVTYEVRATWRLDRLVFDGRELQAASVDAARRREQRRLATQVIRLYFVWKRGLERAADPSRSPRAALAAEAAAAELDALTDGWFGKQRIVVRAP